MTFVSRTVTQPQTASDALLDTLFRRTGVDGVYGRTEEYELAIESLARFISNYRDPRAEVLRYPPVISRSLIEKLGYLKSFPKFLGCVCSLAGAESEVNAAMDRLQVGQDWTTALSPSDLVLAPAACYAVYPLAAARPIPTAGLLFDVACDCFRREPSRDIDRFQSFRMREFVLIGASDQVEDFRKGWIDRASEMADGLQLSYRVEAASDPFFGRGGVLLSRTQAEQRLKYELLVPIRSAEQPTACMSFNYHRDHFGTAMELRVETGEVAHSSCVAFGMDRLVVALFATHGSRVDQWPSSVRSKLGL